jgi:hypothetical protein
MRSALEFLRPNSDLSAEVGLIRSHVDRLANGSPDRLNKLRIAYVEELAEGNRFTKQVQDERIGLPPFGWMPAPSVRVAELRPFVQATYAMGAPKVHPSASDPFIRLWNPKTRRSAMLQRLINQDEHVRRSFGQVAGGTVVLDGRNDGTVCCTSSALTGDAGSGSQGQSPAYHPLTMYDLFQQLDKQVQDEAAEVYKKQNPGYGMIGIGLSGLMGMGVNMGMNGPVAGVVNAMQSIYGPDDSVEATDVAVFRLDTDRLEQMYQLYRQITSKHNDNAKATIDHLRA